MRCPSCESRKSTKLKVNGHRFKEAGLNNVTLHGVTVYRCTNCGESVFDYGDVNQLNRLIAETLLRKKELLTGPEIRFVRTHIGYSSAMFARLIGLSDKTSLSRIENGRVRVSGQVNMSVRFAVGGKLADRGYDLHDLYEAIEKQDLISFKKAEFRASPRGSWQLQAG